MNICRLRSTYLSNYTELNAATTLEFITISAIVHKRVLSWNLLNVILDIKFYYIKQIC